MSPCRPRDAASAAPVGLLRPRPRPAPTRTRARGSLRVAGFFALVLALAFALTLPSAAWARDAVAFTLLGADGRPVSGGEVAVVGRPGAVAIGPDGVFRLEIVPPVPFDIVAFDAVGAVIGRARVTDASGGTFTLEPQIGESVRVASGVAPSTASSPAAAATRLSRDEKDRLRPNRLVDVLRDVPGTGVSGSGQTAVPTVRGLSRGRTLILVDDARIATERRAGPSAGFLDPFSLESVEVVRGPGSVAWGSDAIGGIVHARTPRPRPGESGGRLEVGGGVGEPYGSVAGEWNAPVGKGAVLVQGHARAFSDYHTPDGREPNSSARDRGGLVRWAAPVGAGRLGFGIQVDRARDVERPRDDTDRRVTVNPTDDSDRATWSYDRPTWRGFTDIELRAFLGEIDRVTERTTFATATSPETVERSTVTARDASFRAVANRTIGAGAVRLGVDGRSRFDLRAEDRVFDRASDGIVVVSVDSTSIEDAESLDLGLFGEYERMLAEGRVTFDVGLRVDRVETESRGGAFGDRSTSDEAASGYGAARFRLSPEWELSLQAARGFREPTLSDRYFVGTTGRGRIEGNPDLVAEASRQLDVALRGTVASWELAAYAYAYRISDLIERFEVAPDEFRFRNRGEQDVRGFEVELDRVWNARWSTRVVANVARGEIRDDDSPAADIPPTSLRATLNHRPSDRWWWRTTVEAVRRDSRAGESEAVVPGYVLLDAAAGFRVYEGFELRVSVTNALDKRYPSSADRRAPLAPGTSASLVASFVFK